MNKNIIYANLKIIFIVSLLLRVLFVNLNNKLRKYVLKKTC